TVLGPLPMAAEISSRRLRRRHTRSAAHGEQRGGIKPQAVGEEHRRRAKRPATGVGRIWPKHVRVTSCAAAATPSGSPQDRGLALGLTVGRSRASLQVLGRKLCRAKFSGVAIVSALI